MCGIAGISVYGYLSAAMVPQLMLIKVLCSAGHELMTSRTLQPLHNPADLLVRPISNRQANMAACDLAGTISSSCSMANLAEKVARDHVTPNLVSPDGEGFLPSPMGALKISLASFGESAP